MLLNDKQLVTVNIRIYNNMLYANNSVGTIMEIYDVLFYFYS